VTDASIVRPRQIVFYARTAIAVGQECTYDYRFESEDGKVPCFCGARNCRGVLC
jgi:hypothetical protein